MDLTKRSWGRFDMPASIDRSTYADMFGPTTGDKVRLADTDLIIEVRARPDHLW